MKNIVNAARMMVSRGFSFAVSFLFSWPDASKDKCLECGVIRKSHESRSHKFKEKEK